MSINISIFRVRKWIIHFLQIQHTKNMFALIDVTAVYFIVFITSTTSVYCGALVKLT